MQPGENIADKYVGKNLKYLSIFDKTLKKTIAKPTTKIAFTIDNLVDILTPSKMEDIPANIIVCKLTENSYNAILSQAKQQFEKVFNILQANYWKELSDVASSRKNWDPIRFIADVRMSGETLSESRKYNVMCDLLLDLYGVITILRTIDDFADRSVSYLDFGYD